MPMPVCKQTDISLEMQSLKGLQSKLKAYEKLLDQSQKKPKSFSSCYDSYFGSMFLDEISSGKTCKEQMKIVHNSILTEISTEKEKYKTVKDKKSLKALSDLRIEITNETKKLLSY